MKSVEKLILFLLFSLLNMSLVLGHYTPKQSDSLKFDKSGLIEFFSNNFKLYHKTDFINQKYIAYQKLCDFSYCIAEPGEKFNETDLRDSRLCNSRLVFYGKVKEVLGIKNNIEFVLYEEDHGGGKGISCDIFEVGDDKLNKFVGIYLPPGTKTIKKLKKYIEAGRYTIVYRFYIHEGKKYEMNW